VCRSMGVLPKKREKKRFSSSWGGGDVSSKAQGKEGGPSASKKEDWLRKEGMNHPPEELYGVTKKGKESPQGGAPFRLTEENLCRKWEADKGDARIRFPEEPVVQTLTCVGEEKKCADLR